MEKQTRDSERISRIKQLDSMVQEMYAYAKEYKLNMMVIIDNPEDEQKAMLARACTTRFVVSAIRSLMQEESAAMEIIRKENPELFGRPQEDGPADMPEGLKQALKSLGIPENALEKVHTFDINGNRIGGIVIPNPDKDEKKEDPVKEKAVKNGVRITKNIMIGSLVLNLAILLGFAIYGIIKAAS